jgi:hypothetical protein
LVKNPFLTDLNGGQPYPADFAACPALTILATEFPWVFDWPEACSVFCENEPRFGARD